jgi:hypothetical protein
MRREVILSVWVNRDNLLRKDIIDVSRPTSFLCREKRDSRETNDFLYIVKGE